VSAKGQKLAAWVSYAKRSRFARDVVIVAGGTGVAQAIAIAFSPVITRLYGPEAFGIVGVFMAIVTIASQVATLSYAHAIVLPPSDREALVLIRLSALIAVGFAGFLLIIFGASHHQIGNALGFGTFSVYLLLVPPVVFCSAIAQALQQWLIRKRRFRSISGVEITQAIASGVSKSGIGLIAATTATLLLLNVGTYAFRLILMWLAARRTLPGQREAANPSHGSTEEVPLRNVGYAYRDFPFYRTPQLLLGSISQGVPPMLLASLFGPSAAGFYALSRRVLHLPVVLISDAVGKVFLPRITEAAHRGEKLQPLILKAMGGLALTGLLPFGVVIAFGPRLFGLVFGAEWIKAGEYARWLAIWLYSGSISTPCVVSLPVLGLQAQGLLFEAVASASRVGAMIFGALVLTSDVGAIASFSITCMLLSIGRNIWILVRSKTCVRQRFRKDLNEEMRNVPRAD